MIESDRYWPLFAKAIGHGELIEDERFNSGFTRFVNTQELVAIIDGIIKERTLAEWTEILNRDRIIWAPARTLAEAVRDENANDTGMFVTVKHPELGEFKTVAPPFRMSGHAMVGDSPAPILAADTAGVLKEAGVDDETVALLVAAAG